MRIKEEVGTVKIRPEKLILYIITLLPILVLIIFYGALPDVIPIHRTLSFEPDLWSGKSVLWLYALFSAVGVGAMELPLFLKTAESSKKRTIAEYAYAVLMLAALCITVGTALL